MRIYVVHPGAAFSTHDVYTGVVGGLRAQGCDVYEGRLDTILSYHETALAAGIQTGAFREPPVTVNLQHWASAHVTQHILDVRPDWVLVVSGGNYYARDAQNLRRTGQKMAVLLTESPYVTEEIPIAAHYDVAFTCERASVSAFRQVQPRTHYLPHAYNPAIHAADGPHAPSCDVVFVGSLFAERAAAIAALRADGVDVLVRGYLLDDDTRDLVPNIETAMYYRSAAVSLNIHRTTTAHGSGEHIAAGAAESLNPRAYEIAACGGFQLMDDSRAERHDVFGEVCPTYRAGDADDLARQVRRWLDDPAGRAATAAAMHAAVQPHSWVQRAGQLLEVLGG